MSLKPIVLLEISRNGPKGHAPNQPHSSLSEQEDNCLLL